MKVLISFIKAKTMPLVSVVGALVLTTSLLPAVAAQTSTGGSIVKEVTSADSAGGMFFGNAAVRIVILDPNAKSGGGVVQATVPVSIVAESEGGKKVAADTFDIPETVLGSGKFEFYLTHSNSIFASGFGIHPLNAFGIGPITNKSEALQLSNPAIGKVAPIVTFGLHGELNTGSKLFENVSFRVLYGDQEILLFYQKSPSQLMLDRNMYGSVSVVHVFISAQDANTNPTVPVQFTVNKDQLKNLFSLSGGIFNIKNNVTFTETAPNTAVFEGEFRLNDTIIPTAKSLVLTLHDKADYNDINSPINNNRTNISTASFVVEDTDGTLSTPNFVTFSNGVSLRLTDLDQNKDSEVADTLRGLVNISIEGVGGDSETVNLIETNANSGVFIIDDPGNNLRTSFTSGPTSNNDGILEFTSHNIHNFIKVTYSDPQNHAGKPETFVARLKLHTTPGNITIPSSVGINDQFVLSVNHLDLNDNPHSKVSYTFTPVNNKAVPLVRGNEALGDFAQLAIQVIGHNNTSPPLNGANKTYSGGYNTFTLVETGQNTGIFESEIGVKDLANALGYSIKSGDKIRITYFDNMESPKYVSSKVMSIV
jgi:hypothetical protein